MHAAAATALVLRMWLRAAGRALDGAEGACVRTGEALDSPELTLREPITPGSYVNVVEVHGRRGRIDSPSCGWLSLM
jgi:hypothetical protein